MYDTIRTGVSQVPRRSIGSGYPQNWSETARRLKDEADWRCVRCGHKHDPAAGYCLTVHHLDMNLEHSDPDLHWWNLIVLDQRCHLSIQSRVNPDQPYFLEHSEWFRIYAAGFYAKKYLGEDLTRDQAEARLWELLNLERAS